MKDNSPTFYGRPEVLCNGNETDSLVQTVKVVSEHIVMSFGIKKCTVLA